MNLTTIYLRGTAPAWATLLSSLAPTSRPSSLESDSEMQDPEDINGWPEHWYDDEGKFACLAQGCGTRFDGTNFTLRHFHWNDGDSSHPCYNDHRIFFSIAQQTRCAHCNEYSGSLKYLLAHEQLHHGRSDMSSIQGYLRLMRQDLNTNTPEAIACRVAAFQRLVENIGKSPYLHNLLYRQYWPSWPLQTGPWTHLAPIISYQNACFGRPQATVILAKDFLSQLRPGVNDTLAWRETYYALTKEYAEGRI